MNTPEKKTVPFNYEPTPKRFTKSKDFIGSKLNFDTDVEDSHETINRKF